jgi:retinol-binding protein 3
MPLSSGEAPTPSRRRASGWTVTTTVVAVLLVATVAVPSKVSAQPSPNQPDMTLDARTKAEAIASLAAALRDAYVIPDVGEAVAKALEERDRHGEYDAVTSAKAFSQLVTKQMAEVAHDKHLRLAYSAGVLPPWTVSKTGEPPPSPCAECELRQARSSNYGFERIERLTGNIGYVKLDGFSDAEGGDAVAAGAMALVRNTDALIIDLRDNHGGGPSMFAFLASYFFSDPIHLTDLAWHIAGTKDYNVTQMWTMPYVPGQRYLNKDLYVLTSARTFSIAEAFVDAFQTQKRATVVGETTGGGANGGGPYRISEHFFAAMPMGRMVNPVTKANWEAKGIEPDRKVSEKDALPTAHRLAVQHLIEKTTDQQALASLKQALATLDSKK